MTELVAEGMKLTILRVYQTQMDEVVQRRSGHTNRILPAKRLTIQLEHGKKVCEGCGGELFPWNLPMGLHLRKEYGNIPGDFLNNFSKRYPAGPMKDFQDQWTSHVPGLKVEDEATVAERKREKSTWTLPEGANCAHFPKPESIPADMLAEYDLFLYNAARKLELRRRTEARERGARSDVRRREIEEQVALRKDYLNLLKKLEDDLWAAAAFSVLEKEAMVPIMESFYNNANMKEKEWRQAGYANRLEVARMKQEKDDWDAEEEKFSRCNQCHRRFFPWAEPWARSYREHLL